MPDKSAITLTHVHDDRVVVSFRPTTGQDVSLFEYVYRPVSTEFEGPKPYLHPVRTLAGEVVTTFRPHDHRWHKGIQMTIAHLSGQNFWGGNTYVHGRGYVPLAEVGRITHAQWQTLASGDKSPEGVAFLEHDLVWTASTGEDWVAERRTLVVREVHEQEGWWSLEFRSTLRNIRDKALDFGSPTTHGRPQAGYGGLFWRGPRDFAQPGATVIGPNDMTGEEMMGVAAPWLAFLGSHDGSDSVSTLLFVNEPDSFRFPTKWFVRTAATPVVAFAPVFDDPHILNPGDAFSLHHTIIFADRAWSRAEIEAHIAAR